MSLYSFSTVIGILFYQCLLLYKFVTYYLIDIYECLDIVCTRLTNTNTLINIE